MQTEGQASSGGQSILDRIVATKRTELARLEEREEWLREAADGAAPPRPFAAALSRPGEVCLLAEIKRRSPSAGPIRPGADPADIARRYAAGGAAALSVLTDREYFDGDIAFLASARDAAELPVLRKDFVISPLQVVEARAHGADAILLIARIVGDGDLRELADLARSFGMDVLVEVHDEAELERALSAGATLVGVNNRDLSRFVTDLAVTERLAPGMPAGVTLVAESGIRAPGDVIRLGAVGVDAVLVGESLMRQADPGAAAHALCGHPKAERTG